MSRNKLILNSDKTKLLVMSSARKHKKFENFKITLDTGNEIIEPKSEEKLLGGLVSNNLLWNNKYCSFKIRKQIVTVVQSKVKYKTKVYTPQNIPDFYQRNTTVYNWRYKRY